MQELSQWFNLSEQKPWEIGIYKTQDNHGREYFNYWDGNSFHWGTAYYGYAKPNQPIESNYVCTEIWRGLASAPSAPSPKPRRNRRVTRYVVMQHQDGFRSVPVGVFDSKKDAEDRAEWSRKNITFAFHPATYQVCIVRNRTPEASQ